MGTNTTNYTIHKASDRGHSQTNWLNSYHTFSFSHFYDPQRMGFRALRVINDDRIAANAGFPTHGHRDMEILTYVLSGAVEHKDSLGTGSIIRAGEVQIMSAGRGISHSEFNPSAREELHLLQIWILPDTQNLKPRYEQKQFNIIDNPGSLQLIAAKDGKNGAITIHQDVNLYAAVVKSGDKIKYTVSPHRYAWLQVAKGTVNFNNTLLVTGDGVQISGSENLEISSDDSGEILLFDLY